jgi:GH15 family glucan-1,4-alpha-glucosidase
MPQARRVGGTARRSARHRWPAPAGEAGKVATSTAREVSAIENANATSFAADSDDPLSVEDYAIIGDCTTAALVGRNGSIDWLCWPRFDSSACFAGLLGHAKHGRWSIAPAGATLRVIRSYVGDTLVLETVFETATGSIALVDFMPVRAGSTAVVRIVEGRSGTVPVRMNLTLRFDYGSSIPWVSRSPDESGLVAIAGRNLVVVRGTAPMHGEDLSTTSDFDLAAGQHAWFVISYGQSHQPAPEPFEVQAALEETLAVWRKWSDRCTYRGRRRDIVIRSLLTLKAMTFAETGAIVASPTTSLPEQLGGTRNWDYRYCWIRDATLTLGALMGGGYYEEAGAWREWLHRAVAGTPDDLQIMYGVFGERRLAEWEVPWLPGYQGAAPVRVGNAASGQLQLDVWGELMGALHLAREGGLAAWPSGWDMQRRALEHLEAIWMQPDDGIWEMRGGRRHFTHSKVMAWVAFDRTIRDAERYQLDAPLERWRAVRDEIHRAVCERGYNSSKGAFTQVFGGEDLDASLLLIAHTGFLPVSDPRVAGTIAAIERELLTDGFVMRYRTESGADGLPPGEGVFLPCSFWLADVYQMQGRHEESDALIGRLLALRNDVGLLSEEYDTRMRRQVGNFPQAFTHMALVRSILVQETGVPLREQVARRNAAIRDPAPSPAAAPGTE